MKRHNRTALTLRAETVRYLAGEQLVHAHGGQRAQSNTDEMGECVCITQVTCGMNCLPWTDPM